MLNPENDIENIYRDLAANYPLKVNEAGWEEFEQKLDHASQQPANLSQNTGGVYKRIINMYRFWVAAVVILVAFTGILLHVKHANKQENPVPVASSPKDSAGKNSVTENKEDSTHMPVKPLKQALLQPGDVRGVTTKNDVGEKSLANKLNIVAGSNENKQERQGSENAASNNKSKKVNDATAIEENDLTSQHITIAGNNVTTGDTGKLILKTTGGHIASAQDDSTNSLLPGEIDLANHLQNNFQHDSVSTIDTQENTSVATIKEEKGKEGKKKLVIKIKTLPHKYFYLGVVAGPDINSVKMQHIDCAGLSSGIIAGVQLSPKVSIETGLFYEVKKYYSSGQYVNKQKLGYTDPDDVLKSVDAHGKFLEIPVIVGVNFANRNRHNFSISAGLSSYFTANENYELLYHRQSGQGRMEDRESREWENSFFSAIPLSVGYQLRLNTHNILRIEPYVKLPLYGIGKISLPVISSGIYINITHAFFK
ncbi:MAG TPA: hypothetical protein VG738_04145 [Chitinophagaceae bacterium]|nr:hypothetical protein [Chitinophagaceae bacterium]